jgi:hypothetical protein
MQHAESLPLKMSLPFQYALLCEIAQALSAGKAAKIRSPCIHAPHSRPFVKAEAAAVPVNLPRPFLFESLGLSVDGCEGATSLTAFHLALAQACSHYFDGQNDRQEDELRP